LANAKGISRTSNLAAAFLVVSFGRRRLAAAFPAPTPQFDTYCNSLLKYYKGLACNRRKSGSKLPHSKKAANRQPSRDLETSAATKLRNWPNSPAEPHLREAGFTSSRGHTRSSVFKAPDGSTMLTNTPGIVGPGRVLIDAWAVLVPKPLHWGATRNFRIVAKLLRPI